MKLKSSATWWKTGSTAILYSFGRIAWRQRIFKNWVRSSFLILPSKKNGRRRSWVRILRKIWESFERWKGASLKKRTSSKYISWTLELKMKGGSILDRAWNLWSLWNVLFCRIVIWGRGVTCMNCLSVWTSMRLWSTSTSNAMAWLMRSMGQPFCQSSKSSTRCVTTWTGNSASGTATTSTSLTSASNVSSSQEMISQIYSPKNWRNSSISMSILNAFPSGRIIWRKKESRW